MCIALAAMLSQIAGRVDRVDSSSFLRLPNYAITRDLINCNCD